ncbi:MAG TPA: type Z 30S ribosomal protein S14 [Verrucomicrobiae bacterium]|nr:type Z 30S ribosomal protein S14 [Verrucomicrobiae bacterium]
MAKKSWIAKQTKKTKFKVRRIHRCAVSGRRRAFMRRFGLSRIEFRERALRGELPGVIKASW